MSNYFKLEPVILSINAAGEHKDAVRQLGGVLLAASQQAFFALKVTAVFPQLAEAGIVYDLQLCRTALRIQELKYR